MWQSRLLFSGPLPLWPGSFNRLDLSDNQLSGSIPDHWAGLVMTSGSIDLANNRLQGPTGALWAGTPGSQLTYLGLK